MRPRRRYGVDCRVAMDMLRCRIEVVQCTIRCGQRSCSPCLPRVHNVGYIVEQFDHVHPGRFLSWRLNMRGFGSGSFDPKTLATSVKRPSMKRG